jgi:hypothetical protein
MLTDFWTWLESRQTHIQPEVVASYEYAFKTELQRLIARTRDPALRDKFQEMLDCPIRNAQGQCVSFTDYILGALVKQGIHHRFDMEAALGYVFEKMMLPKTEAGELRATVFGGFDEDRPDAMQGNPLQARFMKYLQYAVRNIAKGKIPRLALAERRPGGTVSIGQGRSKEGNPAYGISSDAIPDRPSKDADLAEMIEDIKWLLLRKQDQAGLPLAAVFRALTSGMSSEQQRATFGDRITRAARSLIVQTIRDYAEATGNYRLQYLLRQFEGFRSTRPMPGGKAHQKVVPPKLSDQERDFRSITQVIARFDHPVGSAQLGSFRRRWLEYPPRDPASEHPNRLSEVLAQMVREGVLKGIQTRQGALVYAPGPNFDLYRLSQPM